MPSGIVLDQQVSIWRKIGATGTYTDEPVYANVMCSIVPISKLDMVTPYAYESTHLVWVPFWLGLRKEDQIRQGRRPPDPFNDSVQARIYTVNGRRGFHLGVPQVAYYARELD